MHLWFIGDDNCSVYNALITDQYQLMDIRNITNRCYQMSRGSVGHGLVYMIPWLQETKCPASAESTLLENL